MGGEIGLMLGASILSFFEVVDIVLFLVYNLLLTLHKNNDTGDDKEYVSVPACDSVQDEVIMAV